MGFESKEISIEDLTGGEVQGAGLFEELMRTVNSHIQTQSDLGRITENNFAAVYLGAMQSAMSEASGYLIQHKLANQDIKLKDQSIINAGLEAELLQKQIDKMDAEIAIAEEQVLKLKAEIALIDAKVLTETKQLDVMDESIANAQKDLEVKDSQLLIQEKQGLLLTEQITNEQATNTQILSNIAKTDAETAILGQRLITEEAQTKDIVGGAPVGGVLGKQIALFDNQAEGYLRDAEQKAAKIMNDTFITRVSTDWDNPNATAAGLDDASVKRVIDVLTAGVGV